MTLTARAKPKLWIFLVLGPVLLGLIWAGIHAMASGFEDSQYSGRGAGILNALSPGQLAIFFFVGAALCAFALAIAVKSRISKANMLEISDAGITSRVFGGRGTLTWPTVTHLTTQDTWLYVHGKEPGGRTRKLAVSLIHLDRSGEDILAAIEVHRPDLV